MFRFSPSCFGTSIAKGFLLGVFSAMPAEDGAIVSFYNFYEKSLEIGMTGVQSGKAFL